MSLVIDKERVVPPLVDGERLTATEFRRRYEAMPEHVRAELIEGVVYMSSPVRFQGHGKEHVDLGWFLCHYTVYTPGVLAGDNATVRLDDANEPQPDLSMLIEEALGGQTSLTDGGYIEGTPELVAEISNASTRIDLNQKYRAYQRCKAREYLVWRVEDQAFDWFALSDDKFVRLTADSDGVLKSLVFPGLWLDTASMQRRDLSAVLAVLNRGLASPEHAAFVAKLAAAKKPA